MKGLLKNTKTVNLLKCFNGVPCFGEELEAMVERFPFIKKRTWPVFYDLVRSGFLAVKKCHVCVGLFDYFHFGGNLPNYSLANISMTVVFPDFHCK